MTEGRQRQVAQESCRLRVISPEVMSPKETDIKKFRILDCKQAVTLRNFYL